MELGREIAIAFLAAGAGYVFSLIAGVGKLKEQLAYIQGQLTQVMRLLGAVDKVKERHIAMGHAIEKLDRDIKAAHDKIRELRAPN